MESEKNAEEGLNFAELPTQAVASPLAIDTSSLSDSQSVESVRSTPVDDTRYCEHSNLDMEQASEVVEPAHTASAEDSSSEESPNFQCPSCQKVFQNDMSLQRHLKNTKTKCAQNRAESQEATLRPKNEKRKAPQSPEASPRSQHMLKHSASKAGKKAKLENTCYNDEEVQYEELDEHVENILQQPSENGPFGAPQVSNLSQNLQPVNHLRYPQGQTALQSVPHGPYAPSIHQGISDLAPSFVQNLHGPTQNSGYSDFRHNPSQPGMNPAMDGHNSYESSGPANRAKLHQDMQQSLLRQEQYVRDMTGARQAARVAPYGYGPNAARVPPPHGGMNASRNGFENPHPAESHVDRFRTTQELQGPPKEDEVSYPRSISRNSVASAPVSRRQSRQSSQALLRGTKSRGPSRKPSIEAQDITNERHKPLALNIHVETVAKHRVSHELTRPVASIEVDTMDVRTSLHPDTARAMRLYNDSEARLKAQRKEYLTLHGIATRQKKAMADRDMTIGNLQTYNKYLIQQIMQMREAQAFPPPSHAIPEKNHSLSYAQTMTYGPSQSSFMDRLEAVRNPMESMPRQPYSAYQFPAYVTSEQLFAAAYPDYYQSANVQPAPYNQYGQSSDFRAQVVPPQGQSSQMISSQAPPSQMVEAQAPLSQVKSSKSPKTPSLRPQSLCLRRPINRSFHKDAADEDYGADT